MKDKESENILEKPLLFINKFKELIDIKDSLSKEEIEVLKCGLEYYRLHLKYPNILKI